ncbi:chemotaxis protein CheB [Arenimonas sp.]|uniref:chemotaxis protein CheB n=1 Tax=Arenimonas sp. TaxID=1872635 RepID=UPI0035AE5227
MAEAAVRVALLARPGEARDQLRRALAELGAELVAEGDPSELDPATVAGHSPRVVLVSLEPAIEDALERFDDLLGQPDVQVLYDDAEVTRQLDGWDLARWARHLAAKLVGSDVLPPVPGDADPLPQMDLSRMEPGAPPTPAEAMADEKLEDYASESLDLSEWVPTQPKLSDEPRSDEVPDSATAEIPADDLDLDLDLAGLEEALAGGGAAAAAEGPAPEAEASFDLAEGGEEPLLADLELSDEPVRFSSFSDDDAPAPDTLDDDVAALAAQLEAFEANDQRQEARDPEFDISFDEPAGNPSPADAPQATPAPAPSPAAPRIGGFGGFGNLELAPMDDMPAAGPVEVAFAPAPSVTESLGSRLSLADQDAAPRQSMHPGALLVLAGLGGPDAVRQLLAALPVNLPLPVLLYQHLDTGKHDRLVGQLSKASQLPLDLAEDGKLAYPGRVAVLAPGMGARRDGDSISFTGGDLAAVLAALAPADSGVLVLSGADPALVPAVLEIHAAGGLVLAQDPSGCFDSVAAEAVAAAGAASGAPTELAARIVERWH